MISLDTNVMVRFLVDAPDDVDDQASRARGLVSDASKRGEQVFVPAVVLVESVWVLRKVYKLPKPTVVDALEAVVTGGFFVVGDQSAVLSALHDYRSGRGDFADYLICAQAAAVGAGPVYTYDRALHADRRFVEPTRA